MQDRAATPHSAASAGSRFSRSIAARASGQNLTLGTGVLGLHSEILRTWGLLLATADRVPKVTFAAAAEIVSVGWRTAVRNFKG